MRKTLCILIGIIFILHLTGCATQTVVTEDIEVVVTNCEKGIFLPNEEYLAQANICLAFEKLAAYEYYKQLANEHGSYQYNISFEFEGATYQVSRMEEFAIGETITVTGTFTYSDQQIVYAKFE